MRGVTAVAREVRAAGYPEAADLIWRFVMLVDDLVDPDECHLDHDGYCQVHYHSPPCPHAVAKQVLAKRDDPEMEIVL